MAKAGVVWRPLLLIAAGLPLIVFDMRTEHFDYLPDSAGWALVGLGLWQVSLVWPARLAGLATVLSLADLRLPSRWVEIDTVTREQVTARHGLVSSDTPEHLRYDHVNGWRLAAMFAAALLGLVAVLWMVDEFQRRARAGGRPTAAAQLEILRWVLALSAVPFLGATGRAIITGSDFDPVWNNRAELWALPSVAAMLWLTVLLCVESGRRWAMPRRGRPSRFRGAFRDWQA